MFFEKMIEFMIQIFIAIFFQKICAFYGIGRSDRRRRFPPDRVWAFRARFRIQSNGLAEGFPQPRMVSVEKRAQGQKQRCKKPVRGTPGFLHLVFDLRYCQIRYPPRFAICHKRRVGTSNG